MARRNSQIYKTAATRPARSTVRPERERISQTTTRLLQKPRVQLRAFLEMLLNIATKVSTGTGKSIQNETHGAKVFSKHYN